MKMQYQTGRLESLSDKIKLTTTGLITKARLECSHLARSLYPAVRSRISFHSMVLTNFIAMFRNNIDKVLDINKQHLDLLSQRNADLDPERIFERGYSVTLHKGRHLRIAG